MNKLPKEHWLSQKWKKLSMKDDFDLPAKWSVSSNRKFNFLCDCGRIINAKFQSVTNGNSKSCGKCSFKTKGYWLTQKWGKLRLENTDLLEEWGPSSYIKMPFICDCGRRLHMLFSNVNQGLSKSCGNCAAKSKEFWLSQKWEKLALDPEQKLPDELTPHSSNHVGFVCDCGRLTRVVFYDVTSGKTKSCRHCSFQPKEYWLSRKWGGLKLDASQSLPDEWGPWHENKFQFLCDCGQRKGIAFCDVESENTRSCGCFKTGTSKQSPAYEIYAFVKPLATDAEFSYRFKDNNGSSREYDIYIPSQKLAIEYHGLVWHSEKFLEGKKDHEKYLIATARGDRLIQIYADEWQEKRSIMESTLRELLISVSKIRIKPVFTVEHDTSPEARAFLDTHHYLGASGGCFTVVAKHEDRIVGVWVFMKREAEVVIWHRICWDHAYKAWNPHEKAFRLALPQLREMGFKKLITFSDNRFHTGVLYEKLGLRFEKELKPDYQYANRICRKSKYAFRVPAGVDETVSAAAKDWYRIWDSGKKRFAFDL